jgi:hypothetical protein
MDKHTIEFELEKETKGTYRYQEIDSGQPLAVGSLYVKKHVVGPNPPKKLRITIEAG